MGQHASEFFRLQSEEHLLAWELVHKAKERKPENRPLPPAELMFYSDRMEGQLSALQQYLGQSGVLQVEKLTFHYAGTAEEHLLVAAITDEGVVLPADDAANLLRIPAGTERIESLDASGVASIVTTLMEEKEAETAEKLEQYFEQENTKLERWADDRRRALQLTIDELDREIRELKRASRQLSSLQEKLEAKRLIKTKERERDQAMAEYHESKKTIEQQEDRLLDEIEAKLELETKTETLFTVRWTLTH